MRDISIKVVKDVIVDSFKHFVVHDGFEYKKSKNMFVRIDEEFECAYHLTFVAWSQHIDVDVHLYIKSNEVENVIKPLKYKSFTVGNELSLIMNTPNGINTIRNADDFIHVFGISSTEEAIDKLKSRFKVYAIPYFSKMCSLENMDYFFNNPPYDITPTFVGGMTVERYIRGLVIAKLLGRMDYNKLVKIYDSEVLRCPDDLIMDYEEVKEILNK